MYVVPAMALGGELSALKTPTARRQSSATDKLAPAGRPHLVQQVSEQTLLGYVCVPHLSAAWAPQSLLKARENDAPREAGVCGGVGGGKKSSLMPPT